METFRNWAFSVCCAAIFGGILNFILPEGGTQKIYKTVFCVFFLCIILTPIADIDFSKFDIQETYFKSDELDLSENEFNNGSAEYIENEILSSTKEILKNENLNFEDISIKINILKDGSINISKFALTFNDIENPDSLIEKIRQKTGIAPEIIISGEN